jgi:hypothetical protein
MSIPTPAQLRQFAKDYVALWNAHDREGWVANWRAVAPGEFRMLDPVGTPEKRGFKACAEDPWELFNARVHFQHHDRIVLVNGNELAWVLENHLRVDGRTVIGISIETFRFEEDGSVMIRTWYRVPDRDSTERGEMFRTYLPE